MDSLVINDKESFVAPELTAELRVPATRSKACTIVQNTFDKPYPILSTHTRAK